MKSKDDRIFTSARNYVNFADDNVSEFQEPTVSISSRVSSLMALSNQRKHGRIIAKLRREKVEKQIETAIRLAKQKKMELDELEENNRKWLAVAALPDFELLDAVYKGSQSKTSARARRLLRSEKAVQDWINNSLALSVHIEKTGGQREATRSNQQTVKQLHTNIQLPKIKKYYNKRASK